MRLLLDTHALLWWAKGMPHLSATAREAIQNDANEVYVSAASAWEITTKHRLGKLPQAGSLVVDFAMAIDRLGFLPLDITVSHAQDAGQLASSHRDPFDRLLAAQALAERMAFVSLERVFDELGVTRLW